MLSDWNLRYLSVGSWMNSLFIQTWKKWIPFEENCNFLHRKKVCLEGVRPSKLPGDFWFWNEQVFAASLIQKLWVSRNQFTSLDDLITVCFLWGCIVRYQVIESVWRPWIYLIYIHKKYPALEHTYGKSSSVYSSNPGELQTLKSLILACRKSWNWQPQQQQRGSWMKA